MFFKFFMIESKETFGEYFIYIVSDETANGVGNDIECFH